MIFESGAYGDATYLAFGNDVAMRGANGIDVASNDSGGAP